MKKYPALLLVLVSTLASAGNALDTCQSVQKGNLDLADQMKAFVTATYKAGEGKSLEYLNQWNYAPKVVYPDSPDYLMTREMMISKMMKICDKSKGERKLTSVVKEIMYWVKI